jgi:hypothetical protein
MLPNEPKYDMAYTFMLLHELPSSYKKETVSAILSSIKPGGKAIFIDYHKPTSIFLQIYLWCIFRIFEPYGFQILKEEIQTFSDFHFNNNFIWQKKTLFYEMFQIVIVRSLL